MRKFAMLLILALAAPVSAYGAISYEIEGSATLAGGDGSLVSFLATLHFDDEIADFSPRVSQQGFAITRLVVEIDGLVFDSPPTAGAALNFNSVTVSNNPASSSDSITVNFNALDGSFSYLDIYTFDGDFLPNANLSQIANVTSTNTAIGISQFNAVGFGTYLLQPSIVEFIPPPPPPSEPEPAFATAQFAAIVPEPATWLMMMIGFSMVALQIRNRWRSLSA